jgi:hypothetical protein
MFPSCLDAAMLGTGIILPLISKGDGNGDAHDEALICEACRTDVRNKKKKCWLENMNYFNSFRVCELALYMTQWWVLI